MSKTIIISLVVIAVLVVAGIFWAKHHGCGFHGGSFIADKIAKKLDLNDGQKSKMDKLVARLTTLREEFLENQASHKAQILSLISDDTFNRTQATELVDKKIANVNLQKTEMIDLIADFSDSLDSNQRQQVKSFIEHKMNKRHSCFRKRH